MGSSARGRKPNPRKMKPIFLVFCEGQTEETYLNMLRQNYRLSIKIIAKTVGHKISQNIINRNKNEHGNSTKVFLMYDADVKPILEKLKLFNGTLLISSPCLELWFYAHYNLPSDELLTSKNCVEKLKKIDTWSNYNKAYLSPKQEQQLWANRLIAVSNMEQCKLNKNNYSSVSEFIKILESEKQRTYHA